MTIDLEEEIRGLINENKDIISKMEKLDQKLELKETELGVAIEENIKLEEKVVSLLDALNVAVTHANAIYLQMKGILN